MFFKWGCGWANCKHIQKGEAEKYGATILSCQKCGKESRALIAVRQNDGSSIAVDVLPVIRDK